MRLAVLTSTDIRHRYFANALAAKLPVVAVGYEQVAYQQAGLDLSDLTADEAEVVRAHFAERVRQEQAFFGQDAEYIGPPRGRTIPPGDLNSPATLDFLLAREADMVAVFGTNLIKEPLLGRFQGCLINMHLGLSPYYRGTATNFYPLLNLEPQYVGATIHLIDAGIDSGPILRHARPDMLPDDPPHVIGCKTIAAGIAAMIGVLARWSRGDKVEPVRQWKVENSRLYMRKDYHSRQVAELYRKVNSGLLRDAILRANNSSPPQLVQA